MNTSGYRVAIVAAGRGSRLAPLTNTINKALLPVAGRAIISHILEQFPADVEIIVALGHEKEKIKEYLSLAHPERTFIYADVNNIDGPGSGPGYSLLACKEYLQCPFIFTTVDTLVEEPIPEPEVNWLGVAPVNDTATYNSVSIDKGLVINMQDKVACDNTHAFIGLCGIKEYEKFWDVLESNSGLIAGERQISNGLQAIVKSGMAGVEFTWHDTGTTRGYEQANRAIDTEANFDFSKTGEHIYFVQENVIKYFADSIVARQRVDRARMLAGFVPEILHATKHFYTYRAVPGQTLYARVHTELAKMFFQWLQQKFWTDVELSVHEQKSFAYACRTFYHDKTLSRTQAYYDVTESRDSATIVNGVSVPPLADLMKRVEWDTLYVGLPSRFHGDLQYDNVLVTEDADQSFVLLDWRQDFAGLTAYGDRYYDLAKLYGGHIIPYHLIKKNMFSYTEDEGQVTFDVPSTYALQEARGAYNKFLIDHAYDLHKIRTLTALIFLNMSPLHTPPFNKLLHHLGKSELMRALELQSTAAYAS